MLTKSFFTGLKRIVLAGLVLAILPLTFGTAHAQTITVLPDQIPNGITTPSTFKQRLDIVVNGPVTGQSVPITLTLPPKVSLVTGTATPLLGEGVTITLSYELIVYNDETGEEIFVRLLPHADPKTDFIAFAGSFGRTYGDDGYNATRT